MRERPRQRAKFSYFRGPLLMLFNTTRARAGPPDVPKHGSLYRMDGADVLGSVQHNAHAAITSANPPRGTIGGSDAGS